MPRNRNTDLTDTRTHTTGNGTIQSLTRPDFCTSPGFTGSLRTLEDIREQYRVSMLRSVTTSGWSNYSMVEGRAIVFRNKDGKTIKIVSSGEIIDGHEVYVEDENFLDLEEASNG